MLIKPLQIKFLERFKLWVQFSDGVEGVMDYSDHVGVFLKNGINQVFLKMQKLRMVEVRLHGVRILMLIHLIFI